MIQVHFRGVDITDSISINDCYHDMYCEGRSDTLHIRFNDPQNQWDVWQPKVGDEISVSYGSIGTGKMFVDSTAAENGLYTIVAASIPPSAKEGKSKAWQKIFLTQIGKEIAGNHGLSFQSYGVMDVQYAYILQTNETDFSFFQRICTLEGCAFLVYDGTLVLYAQSYLEGIPPVKTITITSDGDYSFVDHSARLYGSCCIERGLYQGNFHVDNGGTRQYVPDMDIPITISSQEEADRYAKNMLRSVNKGMLYGYFYGRVMPEFAAASTANIENDRATSWNGHVFFTHIRNDYGKGRSKVFFRKPLDGY